MDSLRTTIAAGCLGLSFLASGSYRSASAGDVLAPSATLEFAPDIRRVEKDLMAGSPMAGADAAAVRRKVLGRPLTGRADGMPLVRKQVDGLNRRAQPQSEDVPMPSPAGKPPQGADPGLPQFGNSSAVGNLW